MLPPKPFKEKSVCKFWEAEAWDKNLPQAGFVTDFVLATRGFLTPTKFCAWTALFLLSSVLKRDVELDWGPLSLYPNLFVFIIAPPAFCAKSSAMNWGTQNILMKFHEKIADPVIREKKKIRNIILGSATPEALYQLLKPTTKNVRDLDGVLTEVDHGSNVTVIISELATFLGKKNYNMGTVQKLTDLYDCKDADNSYTISRKKQQLRDIYMTFFAATTQEGMEASVPEEAFGQGFLSRILLVSSDVPTRFYAQPYTVEGGPSPEDLQERLAWIAATARGEYTLSDEVRTLHERWYKNFAEKHKNGSMQPGRERDGTHVLKLALLLRIQRYEPGDEIEPRDYKDALKLIKSVQQDAKDTTGTLGFGEVAKKVDSVRKYIRKRGKIKRRAIQMAFASRGILAQELNQAINELVGSGEVHIIRDGKQKAWTSTNGDEEYHWKGYKEE